MMLLALPDSVRRNIRLDYGTAVAPGPCWTWTGTRNRDGYGILCIDTRRTSPHRYVYELSTGGTIPPKWHIDHLCFNKACCAPRHLECVTASTNAKRSYDHLRAVGMPPGAEMIGSGDAAYALGKSRTTLHKWAKDGTLAAHKLPGKNGAYLFHRADVEALKAAS